jgi:hypothetical protein
MEVQETPERKGGVCEKSYKVRRVPEVEVGGRGKEMDTNFIGNPKMAPRDIRSNKNAGSPELYLLFIWYGRSETIITLS